MRSRDWSRSPLGAPSGWPQSLRSVVNLILNSKFPMFVAWGPELAFFYNDAYAEILGGKHPDALGARFYDIWSEIWVDIEPLIARAMAGEATYRENLPLLMRRKGFDEQTWFTFSYSPVYDENGQVAGMYCACTETTAAVLAQRASEEETRRLQRLFAQAPGFMAVLRTRDLVFDLANDAYLHLIGRRDIIGKPVRDALPELAGQGFFELLDRVFDSGEAFVGHRMSAMLQRVAGQALEKRFVDFIFQPIVGIDGRVTGIFVQGSDVTEHQGAEERLRETARQAEQARERLTALLNTVPVGIIMADARGKPLEINPANENIWGRRLPATDSIDDYRQWKGWWANGSERHGQRIEPHEWAIARALRGEEAVRDVAEIEPFDAPGTRRVILIHGAAIRDAQGAITGAVVAQVDITEQMRAEAALRESEAKFRTITDAMPQMVWSTLPNGYHDYFNQRWYEFTGAAVGSSDGEGWLTVFHPDDRQPTRQTWQRSLDTGDEYQVQYRLRHRSGQYRWVLGRALPMRDDAGRIIRWLGTCTDIHDQKLAEEELKLANRRKDEFLAMLAHELRNPLAPISTAAQLLRMAGADSQRVQQASDIIVRQVRHMTELINDLLDVSRVTRGLVSLEREVVDIKAVVGSAVEQALPLIEGRRHALHTTLSAANAPVLGDRTRLVQVLVNLLTNAAKYTPCGGTIWLELEVDAGQVRIAVTDNGSGIEPALLPNIFDLFIQGARTPDRSQGGLGLGLALVKSLLDLHGGRIEARSDGPGHGSTFTVSLPLWRDHDGAPMPLAAAPAARARGTASVMIVDDNVDAAQSLATLLQAQGHPVQVTHDALDALALAAAHAPQAFILDIGLPGMDGYELAQRLRALPQAAQATYIALTGYGQAQDKARALGAGFDHHFVKPIDTDQLAAILTGIS